MRSEARRVSQVSPRPRLARRTSCECGIQLFIIRLTSTDSTSRRDMLFSPLRCFRDSFHTCYHSDNKIGSCHIVLSTRNTQVPEVNTSIQTLSKLMVAINNVQDTIGSDVTNA